MTPGNDAFVIRRILAAVDATATSVGVMHTAALLAAEFDAGLESVFVEDINLLRLAGLPFAREFTGSTALDLHLDYRRMERVLRGNASHIRRVVINATTHLKLRSSLQVARGQVAPELLRAAQAADLFILGKGRAKQGVRIGDIARQVARDAGCSILLVAGDIGQYKSVMTVFTGAECSARLLNAAARVARAVDKILLVLIPAAAAADFRRLRDQARQVQAQGPAPRLAYYQAVGAVTRGLNPQLRRGEEVGIVVMSGGERDIPWSALECSVLLVR